VSVSNFSFYQGFTLNLRDKCVFILYPTLGTTHKGHKGEWLKRDVCTPTQIEENITLELVNSSFLTCNYLVSWCCNF
jgi:hypothetical protein